MTNIYASKEKTSTQTRLPRPVLNGKYVLLINPPWDIPDARNFIMTNALKGRLYPPLGLALLAGYLEQCGARVKILDMQAQQGFFTDLAGPEQPDFVGITSNTVLIENAYKVAGIVKRTWPEIKVVMGGIHPSMMPREVLECMDVDYVIRGEGERSLAWLAGGVPPEKVPGLARIEDGNYTEHPMLDYIENLDEMPMASYHLLPMHLYNPPLGGGLRTPCVSIFSSRGCPGKCTYCVSASLNRLRFRSAGKVVGEIEYLIENYRIRELNFYDDTFCANRKRVRDISRMIIERGIDLTWTCFSRIDYADEETLRLMSKAGCHMICYGVESADEQILKNIRKRMNFAKVLPVTRMTQRAGIRARHSFMLGNPGETRQTMEKTVRFAIDANPDYAQFLITTPYPGTEMYQWAESHGYLKTKDWSKYNFWNVIMDLPTVSEEDILHYVRTCNRRFYFRFGFFWRFVVNLVRYPALIANIFKYALGLAGFKPKR